MENFLPNSFFKSFLAFGLGYLQFRYKEASNNPVLLTHPVFETPSLPVSHVSNKIGPSLPNPPQHTDDQTNTLFSCYIWFMIIMVSIELLTFAFRLIKKYICSYNGNQEISLQDSMNAIDQARTPLITKQTLISQSKAIFLSVIRLTIRYILFYSIFIGILLVVPLLSTAFTYSPIVLTPVSTSLEGNNSAGIPTLMTTQNLSHMPMNERTLSLLIENEYYSPPLTSFPLTPSTNAPILTSKDGNTLFYALIQPPFNYSLQIFNISNPLSPQLASEIPFVSAQNLSQSISAGAAPTFYGQLLSFGEDLMFLLVNTTLQIINVSNTLSPNTIYSYAPTIPDGSQLFAMALSSDGNTLFLLTGVGLTILNTSNPSSPQLLSSLQLSSGPYYDLALNEKYSYLAIAINSGSFSTINISSLTNPVMIVNDYPNFASDGLLTLAFSPNSEILYMTYNGQSQELVILNMSDIVNPSVIYTITTGQNPAYLTLSDDGRHLFVESSPVIEVYDVSDVSSVQILSNIYIPAGVQSLTVSSNTQALYVIDANNQLSIYQLYFNIDVNLYFDVEYPVIDVVDMSFNSFSQFERILNGDILYTATSSAVQLWNVSHPPPLVFLTSISLTGELGLMTTSPIGKTLYLVISDSSSSDNTIYAYDAFNASYLWSIDISDDIEVFVVSSDEKTAFMIYSNEMSETNQLVIMNISNPNNPAIFSSTTLPSFSDTTQITLSANEEIVFITSYQFFIYNISNLLAPVLISTFIQSNVDEYDSFIISSDEKTAFVYSEVLNGNTQQISIINISSFASPVLITSLFFQSSTEPSSMFALSQDGNTLYYGGPDLLIIDVSTLTSPTTLGVYSANEVVAFCLSSDGNTMFIINQALALMVINLKPEYALYMQTNDFFLGKNYPMDLQILRKNINNTYDGNSQIYKFTAAYLYSADLNSLYGYPLVDYSSLPIWINSANLDQAIITFSPDLSSQIENYTLWVGFSTLIDSLIFIGIGPITNASQANDLMVSLISSGYIDTDGYLTSNFNPGVPLFLNSYYSDNETTIRNVLTEYSTQVLTKFSVSSSLSLTLGDLANNNPKIVVNTFSMFPITLNITLSPTNEFVSTNNLPQPSSIADLSTMTLPSLSLPEINKALSQLVIYLGSSASCSGNITISDGLNPVLTQFIPGICDYFIISQPPMLNLSYFQSQIAQVSINTGNQFTITFDPSTFTDYQGQSLTLSLKMQDNSLEIPSWLSVKGYTLTGTPPNQLTNRQLDMVLALSNQYQTIEQPFTISIGISWSYGLELALYCIIVLLIVSGLVVYSSSVYNVLCKRRYQYPKEFTIVAGQEIAPESVYPVGFMEEEIRESRVIVDCLRKRGIAYFYDPTSRLLDKEKLMFLIQDIAEQLIQTQKTKIGLYSSGIISNKELINRLVIADITLGLLDSKLEKATRSAFNIAKRDIWKIVELSKCYEDGVCVFSADIDKLTKLLKTVYADFKRPEIELTQSERGSIHISSPDTSQVLSSNLLQAELQNAQQQMRFGSDGVNIGLLTDAIEAYAFKYQILDISTIDVDIAVLEKTTTSRWWHFDCVSRFLKWDWKLVVWSKKGQEIGYGLGYRILPKALVFYGTAGEHIQGKRIVVQIMNRRGRILREIRLNGAGMDFEREMLKSVHAEF